jgi:hypothetical protein
MPSHVIVKILVPHRINIMMGMVNRTALTRAVCVALSGAIQTAPERPPVPTGHLPRSRRRRFKFEVKQNSKVTPESADKPNAESEPLRSAHSRPAGTPARQRLGPGRHGPPAARDPARDSDSREAASLAGPQYPTRKRTAGPLTRRGGSRGCGRPSCLL